MIDILRHFTRSDLLGRRLRWHQLRHGHVHFDEKRSDRQGRRFEVVRPLLGRGLFLGAALQRSRLEADDQQPAGVAKSLDDEHQIVLRARNEMGTIEDSHGANYLLPRAIFGVHVSGWLALCFTIYLSKSNCCLFMYTGYWECWRHSLYKCSSLTTRSSCFSSTVWPGSCSITSFSPPYR